MPGDPLRPLRPGESFQPSARTWNSFIDAALWVQQNRNQTGGSSGGIDLPEGCVLIKPSVDVERFQPVQIGAPIFDPNSGTSNLFDYWKNNDPVFTAANVTASDENTYGIAQQPIKANAIGVARVRGLTRAKVNVYSTTFNQWATIKPSSDYHKLYALDYGTSRIIQIESGMGDKWAIVDLHSERLQVVGGVLTSNLAPGGTATIGLYKAGGTPSSDTATIKDSFGILDDTIPSGSAVYGTYDPALQIVICEGPRPQFQIYCGKTNATFSPNGTCSCSIWTPNGSGGLSSDTGADSTVVDIGGIGAALPTNTIVYWASIDSVNVLLGFVGGITLPWGCIYCYSSGSVAAWTPVKVGNTTTTIDPTNVPEMNLFTSGTRVFSMTTYATSEENRFGVTQQSFDAGTVGLVRIRGLSPAYVNVTDSTHRFVTVTSLGAWKSGTFGPCLIRQSSGTGAQWVVIDVHSERFARVFGKLTGNISQGGTQTVNLYKDCETTTGESVTIKDTCMLPSGGITSTSNPWVFG